MPGSPPPRCCAACPAPALTYLNGADLCDGCSELVEALGGGEAGLMKLMRFGPTMARRIAAEVTAT